MAMQIIDNFSLNTNKPIDNRFVVGGGNFYTLRNDIPTNRRYQGLRIWDLNDNLPYVWNGTQWISENTLGISGTGTINYVSKFDSSNTIDDSQIFDNGTNVGIGTTTFGSPAAKLQVNGIIRSTGGFYGNGANISVLNIDSLNVTGKIGLNNLPNGTNGQILQSTGTSTQWVNQNTLSVSSATNATNVNIISDATSNNNRYIPFVHGTGNQQIRINTTNSIRINPSNGNIGIGGNAQSYRLYVNGGASIGTSTAPPSSGLRVQGDIVLVNGNIGIGGNAQSYRLYVNGGASIGTTTAPPSNGLRVQGDIVLVGNSSISTTGAHIDFEGPTSGTSVVNPRFFRETNTSGAKAVSFHRGNGTFQEDAKIGVGTSTTLFGAGGGDVILVEPSSSLNSANSVYIGSGASTGQSGVLQVTSKNFGIAVDGASFKAVNNTNHIINFVNAAGTLRGKIRGVNASTVIYETTSDLRLKKDIIEMESMIEKIKMLKPSNYKWKEDDANGFGFIAQEVYNVFPELRPTISSYCDTDCKDFDLDNPVDKNGNPYYYGLDYGQFTPFLTKALQEVIYNYEDLIDKIKNSDSLDDLKNSL